MSLNYARARCHLRCAKAIYNDVIMHLSKDKRDNKKVPSKDKEDWRRYMVIGIKTWLIHVNVWQNHYNIVK